MRGSAENEMRGHPFSSRFGLNILRYVFQLLRKIWSDGMTPNQQPPKRPNDIRPRVVLLAGLVFVSVCVALFFFMKYRNHLGEAVHLMVTKPQQFVQQQVKGGIGAIVVMDAATQLPCIRSVLLGSPAEIAGLRAGDIITEVNGSPTSGKLLAQAVDSIRGFTGGSVTLKVQRAGSTNLSLVLRRSSWNAMGQTNIFQPDVPKLRFLSGSNAPVR
jgi:hypothetical protein